MTRASAGKRVGIIAALTAALLFAAVASDQAQRCGRFDCGEIKPVRGPQVQYTRGLSISTSVPLAALAPVAGGHAATAASAAPANKRSADRSLSASAKAGYVAFFAKSPTLTSDIGQPSDGTELQLAAGIGLLAVGLLGLVYAVVALLLARRQRSVARCGRLWGGA